MEEGESEGVAGAHSGVQSTEPMDLLASAHNRDGWASVGRDCAKLTVLFVALPAAMLIFENRQKGEVPAGKLRRDAPRRIAWIEHDGLE
jgi:hypothetical protein